LKGRTFRCAVELLFLSSRAGFRDCVPTSAVPTGLVIIFLLYPALKRWAKLFRAYGAGFRAVYSTCGVGPRVVTQSLQPLRESAPRFNTEVPPSTDFLLPKYRQHRQRLCHLSPLVSSASKRCSCVHFGCWNITPWPAPVIPSYVYSLALLLPYPAW